MTKYIIGEGVHRTREYHAYGIYPPPEETDAFAVFRHVDRHAAESAIAMKCEFDPEHEAPGSLPHTQLRLFGLKEDAIREITDQITAKLEALGHTATRDEQFYLLQPESGMQIGMFFGKRTSTPPES